MEYHNLYDTYDTYKCITVEHLYITVITSLDVVAMGNYGSVMA